MSRTPQRQPQRRPRVQNRRPKPPKPSIIDRAMGALGISPMLLRRVATLAILSGVGVGGFMVANWFGVPAAIGEQVGEGIGRAGFRVNEVRITGLDRMDRDTVYNIALDQPSLAMPLLDLEGIRHKLLAYGWVADAHVSRRLPGTLLVHVIERQPSAVWQDNGHLTLIAADGVLLEPVKADAMPDLPLVVGPGADRQEVAYQRLLGAAPALRPQVKAATWIGNRRWNLLFASGETLVLPEGDDEAAQALQTFAKIDGTTPLLGKGWIRFDMRDPSRMVARKPGQTINKDITDPDADVAQPAMIEAKKNTANSGQG